MTRLKKNLYPVKELKESSDDTSDETSDDDFFLSAQDLRWIIGEKKGGKQ